MRSTHGSGETIVDAGAKGRVFQFITLEGNNTVLDGFTIQGGEVKAPDTGGGILMVNSSPTLQQLIIQNNQVSGVANILGLGGGIDIEDSSPKLSDVAIVNNQAYSGGGINISPGLGASAPILTRCLILNNEAYHDGGGLRLDHSEATVSQVVVQGNIAGNGGGGINISYGSATLTHLTVVDNRAGYSGGLALNGASLVLTHSILAHNDGGNIYSLGSNNVQVEYTDLYNVGFNHDLGELDATNLELDPRFLVFSNDEDPSNDDLHLNPSSPAFDAGDPFQCSAEVKDGCDPDGSISDLGAYGGQEADWSGYTDGDSDAIYDSWEVVSGLDPAVDDAADDDDGDGLLNEQEYIEGTNPQAADTDGDGQSDAYEIASGSDPQNPLITSDGERTLFVPSEECPTIQSAIEIIPEGKEGRIEVSGGTFNENLVIVNKEVTLLGVQGAEYTTINGGSNGKVITSDQSQITIQGFTIENGFADYSVGGGISLYGSVVELSDLIVQNNSTNYAGGGIGAQSSDLRFESLSVRGNKSSSDGGGIYVGVSHAWMSNSTVSNNEASLQGGGLYLSFCDPEMDNMSITSNRASYNGNAGGGIYFDHANGSLKHSVINLNSAPYGEGGGIYAGYSSPALEHLLLLGNTARRGGAIALFQSNPTVDSLTAVGNSAWTGGGFVLFANAKPTVSHSIIAFNRGANLYSFDAAKSYPASLENSCLYNPTGINHNLKTLSDTNWEVDPQFLIFSNDLNPDNDDLHFHPNSPLIDAGESSVCLTGAESTCDPDGTDPDLGFYSGSDADWASYDDDDHDGIFDVWETAWGLDSTDDDAHGDPDLDGLNNTEEYNYRTNPRVADSDDDGDKDADEIAGDSDPWNPVVKTDGERILSVPRDFATIQEAIDFIPTDKAGTIEVDADQSRFIENLRIDAKGVHLVGLGGRTATILDGNAVSSTLWAQQADVEVEGFTIQNGNAESGGGLFISGSSAQLRNLNVNNNRAVSGGGLSTYASDLAASDSWITDNVVTDRGGGMYLDYSSGELTKLVVSRNQAVYGGGALLLYSSPSLSHSRIERNGSADYGGGLHIAGANPTISYVFILDNYFTDDDALHVGGGIYLGAASPLFNHIILAGNSSVTGGGIYEVDYSDPTFEASIIAYNEGGNLATEASSEITCSATFNYSDVYNPVDWENDITKPVYVGSPKNLEPGFLTYADADGNACTPGSSLECLPSDFHLALYSLLIDAGDPEELDPDETISDMGAYGGSDADACDLDADGYFDYFWPGTITDAPEGFDPADYDCDDLDPDVQGCW